MKPRIFDTASIVAIIIAISSSIFLIGTLSGKLSVINLEKFEIAVDEGIKKIRDEAAKANNQVPVGSVIAFAGPKANIPYGWMLCNGKQIDKNQYYYESLRNSIGYTYGGSVQDGYLLLPDFNGLFLRGIDLKEINDEDGTRIIGNIQEDSTKLPNNSFYTNKDGNHQHVYSAHDMSANRGGKDGYWYSSQTPRSPQTTGDSTHVHKINKGGDKETRPKNVAIYWIIKVAVSNNSKEL